MPVRRNKSPFISRSWVFSAHSVTSIDDDIDSLEDVEDGLTKKGKDVTTIGGGGGRRKREHAIVSLLSQSKDIDNLPRVSDTQSTKSFLILHEKSESLLETGTKIVRVKGILGIELESIFVRGSIPSGRTKGFDHGIFIVKNKELQGVINDYMARCNDAVEMESHGRHDLGLLFLWEKRVLGEVSAHV